MPLMQKVGLPQDNFMKNQECLKMGVCRTYDFRGRPTFLEEIVEKRGKKCYIRRGDGGNAVVVPYL
jgi:hypothetical protein